VIYDHMYEIYDHQSEIYDHMYKTYDHRYEIYDHMYEMHDHLRKATRGSAACPGVYGHMHQIYDPMRQIYDCAYEIYDYILRAALSEGKAMFHCQTRSLYASENGRAVAGKLADFNENIFKNLYQDRLDGPITGHVLV